MDIEALLTSIKNGDTSVKDALTELKNLPYEDMGFAKIDHHRKLRKGFGEVIYGEGKTAEQLVEIIRRFAESKSNVLATRVSPEKYEAVKKAVPDAVYNPTARTLSFTCKPVSQEGRVAILTGGTADMPVAEEALETARFFGANADKFYDVGVAGIHRLFSHLEEIKKANAVIAVAGMEGALPSVVAGLVEVPVIGVPTSVGYGASFSGVAPLLTMLNSCAEGISVVNIDNGFGAGYLAAKINHLIVKGRNG